MGGGGGMDCMRASGSRYGIRVCVLKYMYGRRGGAETRRSRSLVSHNSGTTFYEGCTAETGPNITVHRRTQGYAILCRIYPFSTRQGVPPMTCQQSRSLLCVSPCSSRVFCNRSRILSLRTIFSPDSDEKCNAKTHYFSPAEAFYRSRASP